MKNMLFAELDIHTIDKKQTIEWLDRLDEKYWLWNEYRTCHLLGLMTQTGDFSESKVINSLCKNRFFWTAFVPNFIKEYFENDIFTWTKTKSRVMIIRTKAYQENKVHIDCSPEKFHTTQHKFRIVIQGNTNSLYFRTKKGDIWAPSTQKPFIIDGSWPHGMINNSPLPKYTIALGAPWEHCDSYPGYNPLLWTDTSQLPKSYEKWFDFRKYNL